MFATVVTLITGLVWPLTLIFSLCLFRNPIKAVIARGTFKVGPQGLEVSAPQQQLPSDSSKSDSGLAPTQETVQASGPTSNATSALTYYLPQYHDFMNEIRNRVDAEIPVYMANLKLSREETLRHMFVDYSAALYLERASRVIFGSQIDAINYLVAIGGTAQKDDLRPYYSQAASANPLVYANYPFDMWLQFLLGWDLVRIEGTKVVLTAAGKAIVPYMQTWGYLNSRPLG